MRKTAAIVLATAFVATIAGCSAIPDPGSCTPAGTPGAASSSISVTGALGEKPTVVIPTPTITKRTETSIVIAGKGRTLYQNDIVNAQASLYDGATGKLLNATTYDPAQAIQSTAGSTSDIIGKYSRCLTVGSRSVTTMTALNLLGAAQVQSSGLQPTDTLVLVIDAMKGFRGLATGSLQPLQSGFPAVVTAPDGTPGVTLSLQSVPTDLRYELIRKGDGAKVAKGDSVLLQIQGIDWSTKSVFTSTWTTHVPQVEVAQSVTDSASGTLDPGSAKALIGQTVGSQVLVVVPPKFGYPAGKAPTGYPSNSTMVLVYDILGIE